MAEVSFINPLSDEGRQIIREYGDLNKIFDHDEALMETCIRTSKSEDFRRQPDSKIICGFVHETNAVGNREKRTTRISHRQNLNTSQMRRYSHRMS